MKKIISFIISLCMALNLCSIVVFAQKDDYQKSWELFEGLGILPFKAEEKNDEITRAEFAAVIVSVLGLNDNGVSSVRGESGVPSFGNPNDANDFEDELVVASTQLFGDVGSEHLLYKEIETVARYGIMKGNGSGYFRPDDVLKYEEALKTFVVLCGYNNMALVNGGWISGYLDVASELDILLPEKSVRQTLTKAELIEMFSMVLEAGVGDIVASSGNLVYTKPEKGQSFLNKYMNMGVVKGLVTEVENSTITSPVPAKLNIVVSGQILYNHNKIKTNPYLGRYVEAYYDLDDLTLLYITYSKKDKVIVIPAEDIVGFSDGVLSYEKGNSIKKYNVGATPIIYNGTAKASYDETLFDFQFGDVTITDNGIKDTVIIRDFSNMIIGGIFNDDLKIYSENSETVLELDEDEPCFIYDETGKQIEFSNLSEGDAISYISSDGYTEIYMAPQKISGELNQVNSTEYEIVVDGNTYVVDKKDITSNLSKHIGQKVTFFVNIFGGGFRIVTSGGYDNIAILISSGPETDDISNGWIKLFMKKGEAKLYPLAEKVRYYPQNKTTYERINGEKIEAVLEGYTGLVSFKLNAAGEVIELMLPLQEKELKQEGDGRLWEKSVTTQKAILNLYDKDSFSIGKQVYLDASTGIFSVPTTRVIDKYKSLSTNNFTNAGRFAFSGVKAYYAELDDNIATAMVVNDFGKLQYTPEAYLSVVTSVRLQVNDYDEIRKVVTVTNANNVSTELFSDPDYEDESGNPCTAFDIAAVDFESSVRPIGVGDIIGYNCVSGSTTEVSEVVLVYDADMQNVPGGKKGYLAMATPGSDMYYVKNTSLDIVNEWYSKSSNYLNSSQLLSGFNSVNTIRTQNPIRYEDGATEVFKTNTHKDYGAGKRIMLGYVTQKTDVFFHLTTQDLSIRDSIWVEDGIPLEQKPCPHPGVNPDDYTGIYYQEWQKYVTPSSCILNVDYYDRGIEVRRGKPADIRSYENSGNDASRVLSDTLYNRHIIINDYRTY